MLHPARHVVARRFAAGLILTFASAVPAVTATTEFDYSEFEAAPLSIDHERIRELAARFPVDEDHLVQGIFSGGYYEIDAQHRLVFRSVFVYRIDSEAAVDGWASVSTTWRPWHQERPEIHARVITPDGAVHELDPAVVGEYTPEDDGSNVYGDVQTLRGPLPGVKVGAIIEQQSIVRDSSPFYAPGVLRQMRFGTNVPVGHTRLKIVASNEVALRWQKFRLPELDVDRTDGEETTTLIFDSGPLDPFKEDTSYAPGDVPRRRYVRFSTAESWAAIAKEYSAVVDERIAGSQLGALSKRVRKAKGRREKIEAALAAIQEKIRYTGVEFGDQSILPSAPDETLKRLFGDCKDKSTLLVAVLREAGIEAHVALLRTGSDNDVDPDLPGLGRFDHAIVNVPGEPSLWIDPTDRFARAGEPPVVDQGRLALVASPQTTGLTKIPKSTSDVNVRHERREVYLAREGKARIVETTTVSGAFDRDYRHSFHDENEKSLREKLATYAEGQYLSDGLGELEMSDPNDLSEPMVLTLEALEVGRASTSATHADVRLPLGSLVRELPKLLRTDLEDEEEDEGERPKRTAPFELLTPHVVEIEYVIHPPRGFEVSELPEPSERTFGPAAMRQHYEQNDDGTVLADFRFDSGPAVYSADEVVAVRKEIAAFYKEDAPLIRFHQLGEAYLQAGRIREALDEFRALVEFDPEYSTYRTQVARAYLDAGLGETARQEAQRAVDLGPDSMVAHRTLGLVSAHDLLGRKFRPGMDHAGAERALRKAHELDPEDFQSWGELAILLEHDEQGSRYTKEARLDEAIEAYRALREKLEINNLVPNELAAMLYAGRYDEIVTERSKLPQTSQQDAIYIAALAIQKDAPAAIAEASRITETAEVYRSILQVASEWSGNIRRYPEAAALLSAGARGASNSVELLANAGSLRRLKLHQQSAKEPGPALLHDFFVAAGSGDIDRFAETVSPYVPREQTEELFELVGWIAGQTANDYDSKLDAMFSDTTWVVDGAPSVGYRVLGRRTDQDTLVHYYISSDSDGNRILGLESMVGAVGSMLLELPVEGTFEQQATWLGWLAEDLATRSVDPLLETPLNWLWPHRVEPTPARIRAAAASVMIDKAVAETAWSILVESREDPELADAVAGIDLGLLATAYVLEDWSDVIEILDRIEPEFPRSEETFALRMSALVRLKRFDEAETACKVRLERNPSHPAANSVWADLPALRGDHAEHRRRLEAAIEEGLAGPGEYNNLAWLDIVEGEVDEYTLDLAQQSVAMSDYSDPASLHTLATAYAEVGMVAEARDVLLALLEGGDRRDLEDHDWYVVGRMAEHYRAYDAALSAYSHVERPEDDESDPSRSTRGLADRRVAAIAEIRSAESHR